MQLACAGGVEEATGAEDTAEKLNDGFLRFPARHNVLRGSAVGIARGALGRSRGHVVTVSSRFSARGQDVRLAWKDLVEALRSATQHRLVIALAFFPACSRFETVRR